MTHSSPLNSLRRPRLLVRAARHGLSEYRRPRDLKRITGYADTTSTRRVTARLMDMEHNMEERRVAGDSSYEPARHIELLVALMAESKLPTPHDPANDIETKSRILPANWRIIEGERACA